MSYKKLCKQLYKKFYILDSDDKALIDAVYKIYDGALLNTSCSAAVECLWNIKYNCYDKKITNPKKQFFKMARRIKYDKENALYWINKECEKEDIDTNYVAWLWNMYRANCVLEKCISKCCVKYL